MSLCVVSQRFPLLTDFCQFIRLGGNLGGCLISLLLRQFFLLSTRLHFVLKIGHTTAQAGYVIDVLDYIAQAFFLLSNLLNTLPEFGKLIFLKRNMLLTQPSILGQGFA